MAIGIGLLRQPAGSRPIHPLPSFETYVPEVDLPVGDERFPYLRLIDAYDCTVWSSYQCEVVLAEFDRLVASNQDPKVAAARDLVRQCASDFGSSLWFLGD